jgi:UDP-glucose 4-epimerase
MKNQTELEILGDGNQSKSYLHVSDCVQAMILLVKSSALKDKVSVLNIGSEDQVSVMQIARMVSAGMRLENVKYKTANSANDGRGWVGDVKTMRLDIAKVRSLGWKPLMNSEQAVAKTIKELLD